MYASDLTHRKRAAANFRNLQLQKEWFASGKTIRILGQKGGNDYSYMTQLEEGCIQDECWKLYIPATPQSGNSQEPVILSNMIEIDLGATDATNNGIIFDNAVGYSGPPTRVGLVPVIDDGSIKIPMGGQRFFFNGIDYGSNMYWYSNGAITFGYLLNQGTVSISATEIPAILLGNYDRLTSKFYYSNYTINKNTFDVTKIVVSQSDYYTNQTGLDVAKYQIRLIKELIGNKRQFIEVTVVNAPPSPGYSNNPTVTYFSGTKLDPTGNEVNQDSNGDAIDPRKNSPWNITNGSSFLNPLGSAFSEQSPPPGTTILFESDKEGVMWTASANVFFNYY